MNKGSIKSTRTKTTVMKFWMKTDQTFFIDENYLFRFDAIEYRQPNSTLAENRIEHSSAQHEISTSNYTFMVE